MSWKVRSGCLCRVGLGKTENHGFYFFLNNVHDYLDKALKIIRHGLQNYKEKQVKDDHTSQNCVTFGSGRELCPGLRKGTLGVPAELTSLPFDLGGAINQLLALHLSFISIKSLLYIYTYMFHEFF